MTASMGRPVHKNAERWRWLLYVALAVAGAMLTFVGARAQQSAAEDTAFRKLIDSYCEAWSTGTADAPVKFYVQGDGLVFYGVGAFADHNVEGVHGRDHAAFLSH